MRLPGISEIILIVIVAAIVLIGVRVLGTPARRKSQNLARNEATDEDEKSYEERIKKTRRTRIQVVGVIAVIGGIFILLSSLSLIKWVFWGPIGAIIIMVVGIVTIVAARRR
ncbi:MAG: hypothetical protein MUO90_03125 [Dehalococcoidales bacterium]|nr:hypothetical protein [Dehalococcoidales bacterium]